MARFPRTYLRAGAPPRALVWLFAALNVALLVAALRMGGGVVTDGSGQVTTGWLVAAGIGVTLAVAGAAPLLPLAPAFVAQGQAFALGAQALHAAGHLLRWYYEVPFYDDLLHFGLVMGVGLLALSFARSRGFLFSWRLGPARVAALVWLVATAAAGLWEIFEFLADVLMGTREQDNLEDTMVDMLDGTLGGAVAGAFAWRSVRAEHRAKRLADPVSDELVD